ncbi:hypothetical protein M422DRAFT_46235 [Sphaerobolus stellatus SS14]|uniref:Uncharacterized protein n=1 Tax=Sphaerobolus stellatus (strain SS14) TaxID=990650 RepID=A0A0C9W347_SPHS4|nr:hypothetical protein M422DRAFT_46235 [Sphaerobolus stellatus SS14]
MCMALEQKHNHLINPKHIKQLIPGRVDCSSFPDGLWLDIITTSFIDLDKVFTGCYSLLLDTTFTKLLGMPTFSCAEVSAKVSRAIKTYTKWSLTFHAARQLTLFIYPDTLMNLITMSVSLEDNSPWFSLANTNVLLSLTKP